MKLRQWLLIIRILNILTAILMIAFQIWFTVALLESNAGFLKKIVRIFMPVFIVLLSVTIVTAEFQYDKVIENFKFLQAVPGLALFNLFMASLFVFEFSTLGNQLAGIITAVIFVVIAILMGVMSCLKPSGSDALLPAED